MPILTYKTNVLIIYYFDINITTALTWCHARSCEGEVHAEH